MLDFINKFSKNNKINKSYLSINQFIKMEDINDFIYLKDKVIEIFHIEGMDIYSLSENEMQNKINSFQIFLRAYIPDFKFVVMNYPVDTTSQQDLIKKKISNCSNKIHKDYLNEKLKELKQIEQIETTEYYIILFAANKNDLLENIKSFTRLFSSVCNFNYIDRIKKENILFKLNNMNTKIYI